MVIIGTLGRTRTLTKGVEIPCAIPLHYESIRGRSGTRTPNGLTHYLFSRQAPHPAGYLP